MDKTPLSDEDVEGLGISSLSLERAKLFLNALKKHDFLCLIADEDTHQIKVFTKGEEETIWALACLAESAIEEG